MRVMLFGGTDLTVAIADCLRDMAFPIASVLHVPQRFPISYERGQMHNARHVDMDRWCAAAGVPGRTYDGPVAAAAFAAETGAEFALVAGWFHILPRSLRQRFSFGCAGLHASLLPAFRGGAPLPWAVLSQAKETGISLFELGDGIDDGRLYGQRRVPMGPRVRVGELVVAVQAAAVELVGECLPEIAAGRLRPIPQTGTASYSLQRAPADGHIDWSRSADHIDRLIRAVSAPYPGAFSRLDESRITIWEAEPLQGIEVFGSPGQIARLPEEVDPCVVTGYGTLIIRSATDDVGESALPMLRSAANRRFVGAV